MATATKTEIKVVNAAQIKAAVQTWAKAEHSAIWNLIRLVSRGLVGFDGAARKTRISALKTWVNGAAEEVWGPGAAKDRAAHISKIFTIAERATEAHYARWEKNGTGFYKAYGEFAVPQANPASAKSKPDVVKVPTGSTGNGSAGATGGSWTADQVAGTGAVQGVGAGVVDVDSPAPAGETLPAAPIEGFTVAQAAAAAKESLPAPLPEPPDPTEVWAARISADRGTWKKLVDRLTEKKETIMEPAMVLELMIAIGKKPALFRNTIGVLLQDDFIKGHMVSFIKDNPTMFE